MLHELRGWPHIDRVLTSGGLGDWCEKATRLRQWMGVAAPTIQILVGGGVDLQVLRILAKTGLVEAHAGRAARVPPTVDGAIASQKVAELVEAACP